MNRLQRIECGHTTEEEFVQYMNERHSIWIKRFVLEEQKPWTEDPILRTYKFTNVFRQLDKGTTVLTKMLRDQRDLKFIFLSDPNLIFFNVVWYRLFNYYDHANNLGFVDHYDQLSGYISRLAKEGKRIFTGAWMTTGYIHEDKYVTYLRAVEEAWDNRFRYTKLMLDCNSLETTCQILNELYLVGKFISYELACDFRFTPFLQNATDVLTWANMGPGAQRGLRRLGYPHKNQKECCESMRDIYQKIVCGDLRPLIDNRILTGKHHGWPFELREIEHNLCEFDKYQRVKTGEGRPRSKYPGV